MLSNTKSTSARRLAKVTIAQLAGKLTLELLELPKLILVRFLITLAFNLI